MPFNSASDAFQLHPDVRSYGPSTLLVLVFRTNNSFARLNEARLLLGTLVRLVRDLGAFYTNVFSPIARFQHLIAPHFN